MGYCFFYSILYSLLQQISVILTTVATIPNTMIVFLHSTVTISFDSLMSLLRHTHGSTVIGDKRFVWRLHSRA